MLFERIRSLFVHAWRSVLRAQVCLLGTIVWLNSAHAASFDCTKELSEIERLICANPKLSALDERLDLTFTWVQLDDAVSASRMTEQRQWLKTRNSCKTADCLAAAYLSRIRQLDDGKRLPKRPSKQLSRASCETRSADEADCIEAGLYNPCDNASSLEAWGRCGGSSVEVYERRIKRAALELLLMSRQAKVAKLSPTVFAASSKVWTKSRDKWCEEEAAEFRRTFDAWASEQVNEKPQNSVKPAGQPLGRCLMDLTKSRAEILENYLGIVEGQQIFTFKPEEVHWAGLIKYLQEE